VDARLTAADAGDERGVALQVPTRIGFGADRHRRWVAAQGAWFVFTHDRGVVRAPQDRRLAAERGEHGGSADARSGRDGIHRRRAVPALDEQPGRGIDDRTTRAGRLGVAKPRRVTPDGGLTSVHRTLSISEILTV